MNLKYKTLKGLKEVQFKNFVFLLIAGTINAFGVMLFLYPRETL